MEYYARIYSDKHYYYAKELADMMGILTVRNNLNTTFVSTYLNERLDNRKMPYIYYRSRYLTQVFQNIDDIEKMVREIFDKIFVMIKKKIIDVDKDPFAFIDMGAKGKDYHLKIDLSRFLHFAERCLS